MKNIQTCLLILLCLFHVRVTQATPFHFRDEGQKFFRNILKYHNFNFSFCSKHQLIFRLFILKSSLLFVCMKNIIT